MKREVRNKVETVINHPGGISLIELQRESVRRRVEPRSKRLWESLPLKLQVAFRPE